MALGFRKLEVTCECLFKSAFVWSLMVRSGVSHWNIWKWRAETKRWKLHSKEANTSIIAKTAFLINLNLLCESECYLYIETNKQKSLLWHKPLLSASSDIAVWFILFHHMFKQENVKDRRKKVENAGSVNCVSMFLEFILFCLTAFCTKTSKYKTWTCVIFPFYSCMYSRNDTD